MEFLRIGSPDGAGAGSREAWSVAFVVFVRGANVGGHRRFQPSAVAKKLARFDVVNVGATGLFVVRNPTTPAAFRAALARELPFETHVVVCNARDVLALERDADFGDAALCADVVRFVSVVAAPLRRPLPAMPLAIPDDDEWYVRLLGCKNEFVFGVYRRHMKTIRYLGQIDKALGVPVTTRNWNAIAAVIAILKA